MESTQRNMGAHYPDTGFASAQADTIEPVSTDLRSIVDRQRMEEVTERYGRIMHMVMESVDHLAMSLRASEINSRESVTARRICGTIQDDLEKHRFDVGYLSEFGVAAGQAVDNMRESYQSCLVEESVITKALIVLDEFSDVIQASIKFVDETGEINKDIKEDCLLSLQRLQEKLNEYENVLQQSLRRSRAE